MKARRRRKNFALCFLIFRTVNPRRGCILIFRTGGCCKIYGVRFTPVGGGKGVWKYPCFSLNSSLDPAHPLRFYSLGLFPFLKQLNLCLWGRFKCILG